MNLKMPKKIESGPGKIFLSQIITPDIGLDNSDKKILSKLSEVSDSLKNWKFNLAFPIVCLSDDEDKFILLTGLPIYEAAKKAELEQIWVSLISEKQSEAEKVIEQLTLQSKLNDKVIGSQDIKDFLNFLNNAKSPLTKIRGIGDKYAKKIKENGPYQSQEVMQKKLGQKLSMNWFNAYREWKAKS